MITQFDTFTNVTSNAVINVNIGRPRGYGYVSAPILQGTGSLQFEFLTTNLKGNIRPSSQLGYGLRIGEVKTQVYPFEEPSTTGVYAFGLYCLGSESNLCLGAGNCYFLKFDNTTGSRNFSILKSTSGIGLSSFQVLSSLPTTSDYWGANGAFTIGLQWVVSGTTVTLKGKKGFLTDFSDLSTFISVVDTASSAFVTSIGEGLWMDSGTRSRARVIFDYSRWAGRG